ncbi:39S ribosomal protein L50, mitochondrial [Venturia canescens]|uniref:39S ribosomal protein L50, mitochondrial n=1 Tax=Venturia canescens TaxID=32260 RepID=UPI001C9C4087|nr:39S ribosomal protein L50, mitochondrial [Venturia canescens]
MAALIRHGSKLQCLWSSGASLLIPKNVTEFGVRTLKLKTRRRNVLVRKFEWDGKSLAARGFLRPIKSYEPAADASDKLNRICEEHKLSTDDSTKIDDPLQRFQVFVAAEKEFNYSLPNSVLHEIETVGDLRNFYITPINAQVPLDNMKNENLPKNLHILYDYHRFHPDDDTKFGGKTAFPKSSTIVTGLKYRKKYKGHTQLQSFYH